MSDATGIGSWPGTSARDALRQVRELLDGHLPYLPELPARGPGSDMIGRGAHLLVELPVDLQPSGWRLVDRPGRDAARAAAHLREDLDELAEAYDGYEGPLKLQVCGPWTLAGSVRLARGERVVADAGASRDLADSLAEGVRGHVATVRRLVPGADVVLQIDEPLLPHVVGGRLPTDSGLGRLPAVDEEAAGEALARVVGAHDGPTVVHCCAAQPPLPLLRASGAQALSLDVTLLGPRGWEGVAVAVEDGVALHAGVLPTDGAPARAVEAADVLSRAWDRLELDPALLAAVVVTPTCGLAGLAPDAARAVQRAAVDAAGELADRLAR